MLSLVVIAICGEPPAAPIEALFDELGGTVGRAPDSTLVLPDPRRLVARRQAQVTFREGRWFILCEGINEMSVGGVRLATGESAALAVGDIIRIVDIVIEVRAVPGRLRDADLLASFGADYTPEGLVQPGQEAIDLFPVLAGANPAPPHHAPACLDAFSDLGEEVARTMIEPGRAAVPQPGQRDIDLDPFALIVGAQPEPGHRPPPEPQRFEAAADVSLGAAAPATCKRGHWFIAHFAAYPPDRESQVSQLLQSQSPAAQQVLGKRSCRWVTGTEVVVTLRADGFELALPSQRFTWNTRIETLDFRLRAADAAAEEALLEFVVSIDGFTMAVICLNLQVGQSVAGETVQARVTPARTAFASYASADRSLVVHMVGALQRNTGVDVFLDCLDLQASDVWKPRLEREIVACDQFLLFWSRRARASRWVEWEWNVALRDKGVRALQLHPLEPDVPPPVGLEHLHVGSLHALVAAYYAQQPWWRRAWRALRPH